MIIMYYIKDGMSGGDMMSIASDMIRGHTDAIILAQLMCGDSYGYEINKAIQTVTEGRYELKEATLYTAFRRLEQAGYISSYWGDETTGARRRYYAINDLGRNAYRQYLSDWDQARKMIDSLIKLKGGNDNDRANQNLC